MPDTRAPVAPAPAASRSGGRIHVPPPGGIHVPPPGGIHVPPPGGTILPPPGKTDQNSRAQL